MLKKLLTFLLHMKKLIKRIEYDHLVATDRLYIYIYIYIYSIVFLDVGMPLLESKLLNLLLNPVEIGPSNTSPG